MFLFIVLWNSHIFRLFVLLEDNVKIFTGAGDAQFQATVGFTSRRCFNLWLLSLKSVTSETVSDLLEGSVSPGPLHCLSAHPCFLLCPLPGFLEYILWGKA